MKFPNLLPQFINLDYLSFQIESLLSFASFYLIQLADLLRYLSKVIHRIIILFSKVFHLTGLLNQLLIISFYLLNPKIIRQIFLNLHLIKKCFG